MTRPQRLKCEIPQERKFWSLGPFMIEEEAGVYLVILFAISLVVIGGIAKFF